MKLPIRVTRGSLCILGNSGPSTSLSCATELRRRHASTVIERNWKIRNGLPDLPIRAWRKNAGHGVSSLTATAITSSSGAANTNAQIAGVVSIIRFVSRAARPSDAVGKCIRVRPCSSSASLRQLCNSKYRGISETGT